MAIHQNLLHAYSDTDNPTTIYGRFWISWRTFVTQELLKFGVCFQMTIQQNSHYSQGLAQAYL